MKTPMVSIYVGLEDEPRGEWITFVPRIGDKIEFGGDRVLFKVTEVIIRVTDNIVNCVDVYTEEQS